MRFSSLPFLFGFLPITPRTRPAAVRMSTSDDGTLSLSIPPFGRKYNNPSSEI